MPASLWLRGERCHDAVPMLLIAGCIHAGVSGRSFQSRHRSLGGKGWERKIVEGDTPESMPDGRFLVAEPVSSGWLAVLVFNWSPSDELD